MPCPVPGVCRRALLQSTDSLRRLHDDRVSDVVERAVEVLRRAGEQLTPGLTEEELHGLERRFGFGFAPDHRALLRTVLPAGEGWPDWRSGDPADLERRLHWPVDGVLFDVRENAFWPASWGPRPGEEAAALAVARGRLSAVPRLVPLFSHRYMPAAPAPDPSPVFSVHQSDVIHYGTDLEDYVRHEFWRPGNWSRQGEVARVAFWSDLAEGAEDADL
jgi:hypothetical protein